MLIIFPRVYDRRWPWKLNLIPFCKLPSSSFFSWDCAFLFGCNIFCLAHCALACFFLSFCVYICLQEFHHEFECDNKRVQNLLLKSRVTKFAIENKMHEKKAEQKAHFKNKWRHQKNILRSGSMSNCQWLDSDDENSQSWLQKELEVTLICGQQLTKIREKK